MKEYFSNLPNYLYRAAHKVTFYIGILVGIIGAVAYLTSIRESTITPVTTVITAVSLFLAGYGVYREERIMRAEREATVRLEANLDSFSQNLPDPGPQKERFHAVVSWEIWVNKDVDTEKLVLNLVYVYPRRWWWPWRKRTESKEGIPAQAYGTAQYRKKLKQASAQPYSETDVFAYFGERPSDKRIGFDLELVLITGMPKG